MYLVWKRIPFVDEKLGDLGRREATIMYDAEEVIDYLKMDVEKNAREQMYAESMRFSESDYGLLVYDEDGYLSWDDVMEQIQNEDVVDLQIDEGHYYRIMWVDRFVLEE